MMVRAGNFNRNGLRRVGQRLRANPDESTFITFFIRPLGRMTPLGSLTPLASDLP
jgi:hypothetical protein